VEVVAVLASAMGTLDVAAGVICGDATTAPGWRLMGVVEMALALLFLFWFMKKGRAFLSAAQWKPALNVAQRRMYTALDADGDGSVGDTVGCTALSIAHTGRLNERTNERTNDEWMNVSYRVLTKEEVVAGHKRLGVTPEAAASLYEKMDTNQDGFVSQVSDFNIWKINPWRELVVYLSWMAISAALDKLLEIFGQCDGCTPLVFDHGLHSW
jgi:hypothetical protein